MGLLQSITHTRGSDDVLAKDLNDLLDKDRNSKGWFVGKVVDKNDDVIFYTSPGLRRNLNIEGKKILALGFSDCIEMGVAMFLVNEDYNDDGTRVESPITCVRDFTGQINLTIK